MSNVITYPAEEKRVHLKLGIPPDSVVSSGTYSVPFQRIKDLLSNKPLRQPNRTRPLRHLTHEELKRIAAHSRPPAEWFEGEDERPF